MKKLLLVALLTVAALLFGPLPSRANAGGYFYNCQYHQWYYYR